MGKAVDQTKMENKKKKLGLLPKLLIAIVLGLIIGSVAPGMGKFGEVIIRLGATFTGLFGEFLGFIIPLMIIGFVAPGIADLGTGAGKTLAQTVGVAYGSTLLAGSLAFFVDSALFPMFIKETGDIIGDERAADAFFTSPMPPVMGVMTALILSFVLGLGMAVCHSTTLKDAVDDFAAIINKVISAIVIPLLPFHVYGIFAKLTYTGSMMKMLSSFIAVFAVIIVLHWVILIIQYSIAGAAAKKNPFGMIKNMLPAYATAIGTQSSAATIPVTTNCTKNNGVTDAIAEFVCPLCATIHLSGSTITLTSCSMAVLMMTGGHPSFSMMFPFIMMLGVTMVAAPGVPGGAVMAALGVLESMLGFNEDMLGLMIALYTAQDSFGTACNVTGDGAIAVLMDAITGKKKATV